MVTNSGAQKVKRSRRVGRIASMNVKGGHAVGGGKLNGRSAADRMGDAVRWCNQHGVTRAGVSELSLEQINEVRTSHPRWAVYTSAPFFATVRRGEVVASLGPGIIYRRDLFRQLSSFHLQVDLHAAVNVAREGGLDLHYRLPEGEVFEFPALLLEHFATGEKEWIIGYHAQPAGTSQDARYLRRVGERVIRHSVQSLYDIDVDATIVIVGDANNAKAFRSWSRVSHHVDVIASPDGKITNPIVDTTVQNKITDHSGFLMATVQHS